MLDDDVYLLLRKKSAEEGKSLKELLNELLREGLKNRELRRRKKYHFNIPTRSGHLRPGINIEDRDRLFDLMDELSR